jgi:hypothetical protein
MRHGRGPASDRPDGWRLSLRPSQRPFALQLGGSTPAARTPHRGAHFAFDAT